MQQEKLKREIGSWGLTFNIINVIIGSGIYVLPVLAAQDIGLGSLMAYLFCGILLFLIMLCFAELGSKIPVSGGAFIYIEMAFGPFAGFLMMLVFLIGFGGVAGAAVANALVNTLAVAIPGLAEPWYRALFLSGLFAMLAWVNIRGIKQGIGMIKWITVAKLLPLVFIILVGWLLIDPSNLSWEHSPTLSELGDVTLLLFFAFIGGEAALTVGGEIKNPARIVPRSVLVGISLILIIYILIQLTVLGVLGTEMTNYRDAPLAEIARRLIGAPGTTVILIGASISMLGTIGGIILNLPRLLYAAARDRVLPIPALARIHTKYATPHLAIIVYVILVALLAILGTFRSLVVLASASTLLIYLSVAAAVMQLRKRKFDQGFTIPGGLIVPGLAIVISIWLMAKLPPGEWWSMIVFLGICSGLFILIKLLRKGDTPNDASAS